MIYLIRRFTQVKFLFILGLSLFLSESTKGFADEEGVLIRFSEVPMNTAPPTGFQVSTGLKVSPLLDALEVGAEETKSPLYKIGCDQVTALIESPNAFQPQGFGYPWNGLMTTLKVAYNEHIPVRLRPDDIWHGLVAAFGHYVNTHSEQMRSSVVHHEGVKEIHADFGPGFDYNSADRWKMGISTLANLTKDQINADLFKWIEPDFSTTSLADKFSSNIFLLSAAKSYFAYYGHSACGVSQVRLMGTLADWEKLRTKAKEFRKFGGDLEKWSILTDYVLQHFIESYEGKNHYSFWQKMIVGHERGSGDSGNSGWFLIFSPFSEEGKYVLNSLDEATKTGDFGNIYNSNMIGSTAWFPMKLVYEGGPTFDFNFVGGISGPEYDTATNELKPSLGWAAIKKAPAEAPTSSTQ